MWSTAVPARVRLWRQWSWSGAPTVVGAVEQPAARRLIKAMTKKKRQRKEQERERSRREKEAIKSRRESEEATDLPGLSDLPPDPRAMERMSARMGRLLGQQDFESTNEAQAFMDQHLSESGGSLEDAPRPATPLERAQEVIYDAFEADDARERVKLAEKALEITPDCADAYVILAEETAEDAEEARELYEAGMRAGERALGEEAFTQDADNFWDILETRPYMRSREGFALCLWELGQREEAVENYRRMLELNPEDNQGIRHELADCLLALDRDEQLGELLGRYEEESSAFWVYTRALWAFRQDGSTEEATAALHEAVQTNPYVAQYLLGWKGFPEALEELFMDFGEEGEARRASVRGLRRGAGRPADSRVRVRGDGHRSPAEQGRHGGSRGRGALRDTAFAPGRPRPGSPVEDRE